MIFNERGGVTRAAATWTSLMLMFSVIAMGSALATHDPSTGVQDVDFDFEIDGDTVPDARVGTNLTGPLTGTDWEDVILNTDSDGLYDDGPAVLIGRNGAVPEFQGGDDEQIFAKGGKFGDTSTWTILPGNPGSPQTDLTNVGIWLVLPGEHQNHDGVYNEDTWATLMMERTKKQGTFDLDFEFNQIPWDPYDPTGPTVPQRIPGDIVTAFELKSNPVDPVADLEVVVLVYDPGYLGIGTFPALDRNEDFIADSSVACGTVVTGGGGAIVAVSEPNGTSGPCPQYGDTGFVYRFRGPAAALGSFGLATMNANEIPAPDWGSFTPQGADRDPIPIFNFAEANLNLTRLGLEPGCPGFGSVHAKTRSSIEATADIKDLAGPVDRPVECKIFGNKFHDKDASGTWETATEPGLAGWTIKLYSDVGLSNLVGTATTNASGYYEFPISGDGDYWIEEVCPDTNDWYQSAPGTFDVLTNTTAACGDDVFGPITVSAADNVKGPYNFGNYQTASKSGKKYLDSNADGLISGESGLGSWTIYVDYNNNSVADDGEPSAVTSSETATLGQYTITGIVPGNWTVKEVLQEGWTCSFPNPGPPDANGRVASTDCFYSETFLSQDAKIGNDFANWTFGTIEGFKKKDLTGDGLSSDDTALGLWTINVYDNLGAFVASTTTDATTGGYSFDLFPGDYSVCEVLQTDWEQTAPLTPLCTGTGEASGGYAVTVTAGGTASGKDFANTPLSTFFIQFNDLTGYTDATITCTSLTDTEDPDDPDTFTSGKLKVGTYNCQIVIVDP